ncbi:MAG: hypothetical protein J6Q54_00745 [Oscillospiraceae bacterium]|nr:hypothetical protein [Oscillospiraceae bacterium]
MEPWQEEALYRRQWERRPCPVCQGCGQAITTELCLDLSPFGLSGYACEECYSAARIWTDQLEL